MLSYRKLLCLLIPGLLSAAVLEPATATAQEDIGAAGLVVVEQMVAQQRNPECPTVQTTYDPWTGAASYVCPSASTTKNARSAPRRH